MEARAKGRAACARVFPEIRQAPECEDHSFLSPVSPGEWPVYPTLTPHHLCPSLVLCNKHQQSGAERKEAMGSNSSSAF